MKKLVTLALAIILSGCATVGRKIDMTKVEEIKKGESTQSDVIKLIGSPDQITKAGNLTSLTYIYTRVSAQGQNFIPVVGAFSSGYNTQQQMVIVQIGADGKVADVISTVSGMEANSGASAGSKADIKEVQTNKRPK